MKRYILIYQYGEYADTVTKEETFATSNELHEKAEQILTEGGEVLLSAVLADRYEYEPFVSVKSYRVNR